MGELGAEAADVFPDLTEDLLDLRVALFRKGCAQVVSPDAMFGQIGTEPPCAPAGEVRRLVWIEAPQHAQPEHRDRAK